MIASFFLALQPANPAAAVGATTLTFSSTSPSSYTGDNSLVGEGTISWAPWTTGDPLNADILNANSGAKNWFGGAWGGHNFAVQDDGSGTNNALWVHKAHAGYLTEGMMVQNANGLTLVNPTNTTVTAKVKAQDANVGVRVRMTDGAGANAIMATATAVTAGAWNTLTFSFTGASAPVAGRSYSKMFFEFDYSGAISGTSGDDWGFGGGSVGLSKVYMLDDVTFTSATGCTPAANATLITSEPTDASNANPIAFEGAQVSIAGPPDGGSYGNTAAIKIVKPVGAQPWAGVTIINSACSYFGLDGKVSANVWAPAAGMRMNIKLEDGVPANAIERSVYTTTSGWQTLTWDTTGLTAHTNMVSFFPDFLATASGQVVYLDDVAFNGITSPKVGYTKAGLSEYDTTANDGAYVHVRLQRSTLTPSFDASWWDGIWQYRDADTRAYVKYFAARSTFNLTYKVTDKNGDAMVNTPVSLIVNVNWSCSKATFTSGSITIPRDDCSGNGQTVLPSKNTNSKGEVTFTITNTNATGEPMPSSLSKAPSVGVANEIGTNIKPHVADKEGVDMLLAHFIEPKGVTTVSGQSSVSYSMETKAPLTFTVKDENGKPLAGVPVTFINDGQGTVSRTATTDADGNVTAIVNNPTDRAGVQRVTAMYKPWGGLEASATTTINWTSSVPVATVSGGKGLVNLVVTGAKGLSAKVTVVGGSTVTKSLGSDSVAFTVKATAGTRTVKVTINGVTTSSTVKVTK
jgi:hypothetical protein